MSELTLKALTAERLKIRKDNPVRSNVLLMLTSAVKDVTIDERRPETPADFGKAALKMYNEVKLNIEDYKKNGADTADLEAELKEISTFLPKMMSQEEMEAEVKKVIDSLPEGDRALKNIMPKLKTIEGFDMKAAKGIIEKLLG